MVWVGYWFGFFGLLGFSFVFLDMPGSEPLKFVVMTGLNCEV